MNYYYDDDLGIDYRDLPPWRSYSLETQGTNLQELIINATVSEIDQEGEVLNIYGLDDGPNEVCNAAYLVIQGLIEEGAIQTLRNNVNNDLQYLTDKLYGDHK